MLNHLLRRSMSCLFLCGTCLDTHWYWSTGMSVTPCNFLLPVLGFTNGPAHLWEHCCYLLLSRRAEEKAMRNGPSSVWLGKQGHALKPHFCYCYKCRSPGTPCLCLVRWCDGRAANLSCLDEGCVHCCHNTAHHIRVCIYYLLACVEVVLILNWTLSCFICD